MTVRSKHSVGDRLGMLVLVKTFRKNARTYWLCKCDCGKETDIQCGSIFRTDRPAKRSCGCDTNKRKRKGLVKARTVLRELRPDDPTPLEIAERCLDIHNEADRQAPVGLVENLKRLRQANVRTDSPGASRRPTVALLETCRRYEDSDSG